MLTDIQRAQLRRACRIEVRACDWYPPAWQRAWVLGWALIGAAIEMEGGR